MSATVDMRNILLPNSSNPTYASNYPNGDRPAGGTGYHTIIGSGFGSKNTGIPYFDNFETRTLGAANGSTLGSATQMAISNPDYVSIVNSGSHSGTRVVKMDYQAASAAAGGNPSSSLMFPKIYHELGTRSQYGYAAFWIKWTGSASSNSNVWKMSRFTNDSSDPYSGTNSVVFSYTSQAGASAPSDYSGQSQGDVAPFQYWGTTPSSINPSTQSPLYNPATLFTKDSWHLYEVEFDVGTLNTANAIVEERWDKTLTVRHGNGSNSMTYKTTAHPNDVYSIMSPLCGLDDYSNIIMYMDEAYFDGSRCRVVMTDSATYSSWTKWAIQPIATYSNTNITAVKNKGMFTTGDTAYLHVFNSSGSLVYSSSSITVTEDNV